MHGPIASMPRSTAARQIQPQTVPRLPSRSAMRVTCAVTPILDKPSLRYVGAAATASADGMCNEKTAWPSSSGAAAGLRPPKISKADSEFASLGLEFVETSEGIAVSELNDLFSKVDFPRRDNARLQAALENTHRLVWVRNIKQTRMARMGQLVGFARATSDKVFTATIWDVAVAPAYQRLGLGRALVERLTARLVDDGIPTITLYAEPKVVGLYEKLGFMKDPAGIKGMAFQRQQPAPRR